MQISKIVLYSKKGKIHKIPFKLGRVNIVSGKSQRGKSAILAVVDYCLGARKLGVPAGIIQDAVSWYGLELDFSGEKLFIARQGVAADRNVSNNWHIGYEVADFAGLRGGYGKTDLSAKISGKLGIQTTFLARSDGEYERKSATFRSGLVFSFQKQNEIANQDLFFHRQGDPQISQMIRDFLPYYLGAISEDIIAQQEQLRAKKKRLKEVERDLSRLVDIDGRRDSEASYLISEARRTGLLQAASPTPSPEANLKLLAAVEELSVSELEKPGEDVIHELSEKIAAAQAIRSDVKKEIEALEAFGEDQALYSDGVNEQRRRLQAINHRGWL